MSVIPCSSESLNCSLSGSHESATWQPAAPSSFAHIPRICRTILAVYEPDLSHPAWAPHPHGYQMDPALILKRAAYEETADRSPPYIIYLDERHKEIVLAVRGLDLANEGDYRILLDNSKQAFQNGYKKTYRYFFDKPPKVCVLNFHARFNLRRAVSGYVHRGLLKSAVWILNREVEFLDGVVRKCGSEWSIVFCGHSLGAGVAALMAVVAVNYLERFGGIQRRRVRGYAVSPPRCLSLSVAAEYADVVHSVVLQDDFLPRSSAGLEHIFSSIFCLPWLLLMACVRDAFVSEQKVKDPKRLYAPGRIYHIVQRKPYSCGTVNSEVRTAIPTEGRLEHVVLSCNSICDHRIVWIEREAQKALDRMEKDEEEIPPLRQKMNREAENIDAVDTALLLV